MKILATAWCWAWLGLTAGRVHAGSDVAAPRADAAAAAEFETYLQAQKINHSIEIADDKDAAPAPVTMTVKIYGELTPARQEAICAALTGAAKRVRMEAATVQFFAMDSGAGTPVVQAARLPSGNADVTPSRATSAPVYRLKRTVRL